MSNNVLVYSPLNLLNYKSFLWLYTHVHKCTTSTYLVLQRV